MNQEINISNLPQTPQLYNKIVEMMKGRQVELSQKWGIGQPTVSYQIKMMREGRRLNPKTWTRIAQFYLECLEVQRRVEQYLNS